MMTITNFHLISEEVSCSNHVCKQGKELSDKNNTTFTCRHLDLVKEGPVCQPQSPILCETIRYTTVVIEQKHNFNVWSKFGTLKSDILLLLLLLVKLCCY